MTDSLRLRRLADLKDSLASRIVEQATTDEVPVVELPDMTLRWYEIRKAQIGAAQDTGREATVYIYDRIGGSMGTTAATFAEDLAEVDADVIHLRINSPGGSVFDAKAIMNTLRAHPARIVAHIDGVAASAASVVMLAGDRIVVEPGGEIMVHKATVPADGNDDEYERLATVLRRESQNIAELYAQRSGGTPEQWYALMTDETWLFGGEAVQLGIADHAVTLTPNTQPQPVAEDPALEQRMRRRHTLHQYRYEGRAAAPTPPRELPPATFRKADTVTVPTTGRSPRRVTSEHRDAGRMRARAAAAGKMLRTAPAGISTSRVSKPGDAEMRGEMTTVRGRELYHTGGYFTVYGRGYPMWDVFGPYTETVDYASGAQSLAAGPDVVFLMNHAGVSMARTAGPWNQGRGTLDLNEDARGGWHEGYHNPERADVQLMMHGIDGGQLTEMSYAFTIPDGRGVWNDDMTEYRILGWDINRGDVSSVNYGANPYTDITARAAQILEDLEQLPPGAIREAWRRLGTRVDELDAMLRGAEPGSMAFLLDAVSAARPPTPATDADRAEADEWVRQALGRPEPADTTPETTKVIDEPPTSGTTVAAVEAMLASLGVKARP